MKRKGLIIILILSITACGKKQAEPPAPSYPDPPAANGAAVTVTVDEGQPGYAIPASFQGLSYETGILANGSGFFKFYKYGFDTAHQKFRPGYITGGW